MYVRFVAVRLPWKCTIVAYRFDKKEKKGLRGNSYKAGVLENKVGFTAAQNGESARDGLRKALQKVTSGARNYRCKIRLAIAKAVGLKLTLDDFQKVSDRTPFLANMMPSGKYYMYDLFKIGGVPGVLKMLLRARLIDGTIMTVTGSTMADNLSAWPDLEPGNQVIRPLSEPIKKTGHLQFLYGNLAPKGCVAKITGHEGTIFKGIARFFNSELDMITAVEGGEIKRGVKTVVVIRYEGPKGAPGMPGSPRPRRS